MARILIIDDDEAFRSMLQELVAAAGHSVATASDGVKGARLFRAEAFDLVITDLLMSAGQGLDVIMTLRRESPQVRVIAMSADSSNTQFYLEMASRLGAHRVLAKPFTPQELYEAIASLTGGKSGARR